MLVQEKRNTLNSFVNTLSQEELIWINGYLSGLLEHKNNAGVQSAIKKITIAYASETGNSKKLSTQFATNTKKKNIGVKLISLDQYNYSNLENEEYFFIVMSTQGEGEPPPTGLQFYEYIHKEKLNLAKLKFAVLGLGDTGYPLFCKAAEDVFNQLQLLGATPIVNLQKCDLDYETIAINWFDDLLKKINEAPKTNGNIINAEIKSNTITGNPKKNYTGTIIKNINLNDNCSVQKTFHIVIKTNEVVQYELGDSLSIFPKNRIATVQEILQIAKVEMDKKIVLNSSTTSDTLIYLLSEKLNIQYLTKSVLQKYATLNNVTIPLEARLDLLDLLKQYPLNDTINFDEIVAILQKIPPRLYTIASSPIAHQGEIHLTVTLDQFSYENEIRTGLCSNYFSRLAINENITFSIQKNKHFKLTSDSSDIIMIGTGAGIAPFRAFIADREYTGATGKNWLFFGDRNFEFDFLYQTEWQQHLATDTLHKINVAWHKDAIQPSYIQHEIKKEAAAIFEWMENGASIYVCGDKKKMSIAVEQSILEIVKTYKGINDEDAKKILTTWEEKGRYQKDVY
jgi:sulfite reductase (NADPH) flavoprotein alpha-component